MESTARNRTELPPIKILEMSQQTQILDELPDILRHNIEKSDNKYNENTAKQIEILQNQLAKAQDTINEHMFWYIFTVMFLVDCVMLEHISSTIGIICLFLMEFVALICAAKKLGQENALQLLYLAKTMIENFVTKNKGPSCD